MSEWDSQWDDFWDIGSFIPSGKSKKISASFDTSTVEIDLTSGQKTGNAARSRKIPRKNELPDNKPEMILAYEPDVPLIRRAEIRLWNTGYKYYAGFCGDAVMYKDAEGEKCEPKRFFSYIPQYSQMTPGQLRWYLYWRSLVRSGEYPDTDVSYILLYVYELIVLAESGSPEDSLERICDVWRAYREQYYLLDKYLCGWVCDLCLLYALRPPVGIIRPFIGQVRERSGFPEFFCGCGDAESAVMSVYGTYDHANSRYYNEKTANVFDKYIPAAMSYAAEKCGGSLDFLKKPPVEKHISRDAFEGSLCAYNIKRRIDLTVIVYEECLRGKNAHLLGNMKKLAENNVRKLLGIKSRMTVKDVPADVKNAINEYFAPLGKRVSKARKQKTAPAPDYEKYYEAENTELSADSAKKIEEGSWDVTEILTSYSEEEVYEEKEMTGKDEKIRSSHPGDTVREALATLLGGGDLEGYASEKGLMPDALAAMICDELYDTVGDAVLIYGGNGYSVVEDYIDEIEEYLEN